MSKDPVQVPDLNDTDKATAAKKEEGLPNVTKGVGGAGRVSGMLTAETAKDNKGTLRRLLQHLGPFKWPFLTAILLTLVASLAQVIIPKQIGEVINIFASLLTDKLPLNWGLLFRIGAVLLVLYVINVLANYFSNVLMVKVTQRVVKTLRDQMQAKLNRLSLKYLDRSSTGNLASLLTNDLDNVANTLQSGLTTSLSALVLLIGVVIMMLTINALLALLAMVVIPIAYYVVKFIIKKAKPLFQKTARLTGEFNGKIEEAYKGEDVVKYYNLGDDLKTELSELNDSLYDSERKSAYVSFMTRPAGDLILNTNYVLIAIVGGYYVIQGTLSLGGLQAFMQYSQMLRGPFNQALGIFNTIMSALASAERVFAFLDEEESPEFGDESLETEDINGEICFDDVAFGYTDDLLFDGVNLDVQAGEQIAIVGRTGAGKTTLVNLLMRFYEIQGGTIYLDGKDAKTYSTEELRKAYAMVLQDTWLFSGTIRDNIAYGANLIEGQKLDEVDFDQIKAAAEIARADAFIERLPDGYDTVLTEGASNISRGEAQLLTIARAVIKQAPVIILDEATSSVDTRTELLIQHGMKALASHATSFIIAHRLSTIQDADRIIVMDDGTIVEVGTHQQLLDQDGYYAEMFSAGQIENKSESAVGS